MGEMIWPNLGGESEPDDRRTQIGSYYRLVKNMFLLLVSTLKFVNTGLATPSCDLLFLVCESSDSQYSLCILDARIRRLLVSEQSILPLVIRITLGHHGHRQLIYCSLLLHIAPFYFER
jgi:hypothetical protein